jgi:DsbC/DsbD-like thiol-disulfide interchange protein
MKSLFWSWLMGWALLVTAHAQEETSARLLLGEKFAADKTITMALEVTPKKGSHVYYLNPGEMGLPVELAMENLPEGLEASALQYPVPHRTKTGELATFGYSKRTRFPFQLTVSESLQIGDEPIVL